MPILNGDNTHLHHIAVKSKRDLPGTNSDCLGARFIHGNHFTSE